MSSPFDVPSCDKCRKPAIHHQVYSGRMMCGVHLTESVRKKVSKAIRKQLVIPYGGSITILVAISGGKDSAVLLDRIVDALGKNSRVTIVGGCVDEGIEGYRKPSLECARQLCADLGVRFETVSYPELGFIEMDEAVKRIELTNDKKTPCSYCGVFRRQGVNHLAKRVGADVIAFGHNLDDMAQTVLMNLQNGDVDRTLRLAPHTENLIEGMIPRIVPLRWVPEQEVHLYALERGLPIHHDECPHGEGALRFRHREMVALMESDVPGSRHGMLRFADEIKSIHQKSDQKRMAPPKACPVCGEMCSGTICKACEMKESLGSNPSS